MRFLVLIDPHAAQDIRNAMRYYEEQTEGLGERFKAELKRHLAMLQKNPFFRLRYDNVRCLFLKKFPYMIHFTIGEGEKLVKVWAVLHTSRNHKTGS